MPNAIKSIAKYIHKNPDSPGASVLREFCLSLEGEQPFNLGRLYELKPKAFELALELLNEWRFDRHVVSRRLEKYLAEGGD